jgi:hypothetical protein
MFEVTPLEVAMQIPSNMTLTISAKTVFAVVYIDR